MQTLFSTAGLPPMDSFPRWRKVISDHLMAVEFRKLHDGPFSAKLEQAVIGSLVVTHATHGAMRTAATHRPPGGTTAPIRCS